MMDIETPPLPADTLSLRSFSFSWGFFYTPAGTGAMDSWWKAKGRTKLKKGVIGQSANGDLGGFLRGWP